MAMSMALHGPQELANAGRKRPRCMHGKAAGGRAGAHRELLAVVYSDVAAALFQALQSSRGCVGGADGVAAHVEEVSEALRDVVASDV